jgi:hypothetical protein
MLRETRKVCGVSVWLIVHQPLMITTATISNISLLIILSDKGWKWVDNSKIGNYRQFLHSICGIVVIVLAVIQVN